MKKIQAGLLVLIMIFSLLFITSCSNKSGAPEGMILVRGGEDAGYYFYGPEEWIVANMGDISCTYASKVDLSSMTFAESEMPTESISEYFENEKAMFPYEIQITVYGEDCTFGDANKLAKKYVSLVK